MNIKTKYAIGDEVYLCFLEDDGLIRVGKVRIDEICLVKEGVKYYVNPWIGEEWEEKDLISMHNPELLLKKINDLALEVEEDERIN